VCPRIVTFIQSEKLPINVSDIQAIFLENKCVDDEGLHREVADILAKYKAKNRELADRERNRSASTASTSKHFRTTERTVERMVDGRHHTTITTKKVVTKSGMPVMRMPGN